MGKSNVPNHQPDLQNCVQWVPMGLKSNCPRSFEKSKLGQESMVKWFHSTKYTSSEPNHPRYGTLGELEKARVIPLKLACISYA